MQKNDICFGRTFYFGDKSTTFTTNEQEEQGKKLLPGPGGTISFEAWQLALAAGGSVVVASPRAGELWDGFVRNFESVEAAGGVVRNARGETLMIFRNGRWDLPKGHREAGESSEECALREVCEECGLGGLRIVRFLTETLHAYEMRGRREMKTTRWYLMEPAGECAAPVPQTEEGITRAEWLSPRQVAEALAGTYPTIRDVMNEL